MEEARTLRAAGLAALGPALSLRADKLYNAPDTEIDVTEQGGLMWGEHAVGKLVAGADALSPAIAPFVEEDADPQIAEKVKRRLGHWVDRKIAALFQPLIALRDDEALTGMARGIAFRLVEALGVLPRGEVADDVKALDQDQRAGLRKHGVRFGQYTVFQPLMLKPAATRMRLVLWSLKEGFDVFPEAPPPGLVTVPAAQGAPNGYYARAGYRLSGERAIRIDMLERLADMIRGLDARAGFEASPDMLSITGLSLDQFANLMRGMGYQATEGTRPKRRPAKAAAPAAALEPAADEPMAIEAAAPGETPDSIPPAGPDVVPDSVPGEAPPAGPDEVPGDIPPGVPGDVPPGVPGDIPTELPSDVPAETPVEEPTEAPDITPVELPADSPAEMPLEPPAQMSGVSAEAEGVRGEAAPAESVAAESGAGAPPETLEVESFYTFARAPRQRHVRPPHRGNREAEPNGGERRKEARPRGEGQRHNGPRSENPNQPREGQPNRPKVEAEGAGGRPKRGKGGKPDRPDRNNQPAPVAAEQRRPPRQDKPVDPDNPFAALMALKLRN
jgi:ATP-dependent RNA helicase SUPV3L1/SUV3